MGLFDYVTVHFPLPADPAPPATKVFQTKDFDEPYMEQYEITENGRLIHHSVRYDIDPPDKPIGEIEVPFHGDLSFCEYETEGDDRWEYVARFTEGRCMWIKCTQRHHGGLPCAPKTSNP